MFSKFTSLYWLGLICLLAFVAASWYIPLVLNEDPAYGLNVWQSMQKGGAFNHLIYPDPNNPLQNKSVFISWWSPGQYLLPVGWSLLTGWSYERSGLWLTLLFTAVGVWGWYKVWVQNGFQAPVIAWALFLMLTSRLSTINFLNYTGGETLIFGGAPWVLYWFYCFRSRPIWLFLGMLGLSLLCFVLKTSSSITLLSLVVVPAVEQLIAALRTRKLNLHRSFWLTSIATGLAFVGYYWLTQKFYLQKGTNPTTELNAAFEWSYSVLDLLTFSGQYWLSSHDFVVQLTRYFPDFPLAFMALAGQLLAFGMLLFMAVKVVSSLPQHFQNLSLFVAFYGIYTLFLGYFYGRAAEISFEVRHFKMLAFLFLPLFLEALWSSPQWLRNWTLGLLLMTNTAYGLVTFAIKKAEISHYPTVKGGFSAKITTEADVQWARRLNHEKALVFITDPTLALELDSTSKYLFTYPPMFARKVGFTEEKYQTQGQKLYVVHSKLMANDSNGPQLSLLFPDRTLTKIGETPHYYYYVSE